MHDAEVLKYSQPKNQILLHFDVDGHYLKLETFIETAKRADRIIDSINTSLIKSNSTYDLVVLPPESGSFLAKYTIVMTSVGSLFAFLNSDIGSAYVEGFTGYSPAYWAKQLGENHLEYFDQSQTSNTEKEATVPLEACEIGAKIITQMTKIILEKDNNELEKIGANTGVISDAMEARNEFYQICISNSDVKALGFTHEDDFPIPRNSFPERAAMRVRKNDDDVPEKVEWIVAIENIFVSSPNWEQEDQAFRKWKGKDSTRRECFFEIDDAEFWLHVKQKELKVEGIDRLKVQWAYELSGGRAKNRKVLRVLEFNNEQLAKPLDSDAITAIIGSFSEFKEDNGQGVLFSKS